MSAAGATSAMADYRRVGFALFYRAVRWKAVNPRVAAAKPAFRCHHGHRQLETMSIDHTNYIARSRRTDLTSLF
jgi:hypothetical protein